jgi:hypothetical protein
MAALHGREDVLLEPEAFVRLLRQANDAEVADVRLVAEGEFEVSPHKSDLAMQVRPVADANGTTGVATAQPARPAAALRYRSGMQANKRGGQVAMVGVVQIDGETPAAAAQGTPEQAPADAAAEPKKKTTRRATKTKPKAKAKSAASAKAPATTTPKVSKPATKAPATAAAKPKPKAKRGARKSTAKTDAS